ncbi:MAG TPA: ABC transporter substrate-binding protein, partial [Anaerolineae bacterium]|nr:ABC transporter substrate-binding protein [Anaerolineae bacterium]
MSGRKTLALLVALAMLASLVLAACGPTPEPQIVERVVTQMVVETVVVEGTAQVVEKEVTKVVEVEVEKEVTPVPQTVSFDQAPDPTTLTYVDFGDPASLDPQLAYETSSGEVLENVVEGLIYMRRENAAEFVPMLAEEVPTVENGGLSADGLTYTFKIRDGIQFHEGQDLTASDAAYSWQRGLLQSDPNSGQWMMIEAIMGYSGGDITENIAEGAYAGDRDALIANATPEELVAVCEEVKSHFVVDDDAGTMQVTLAQPWGPFLAIIAKYWAYVIDQDWAIAQGDWDGSCDTWQNFYAPGQEGTKLARVVNGTGPYKLDHWTPDEEWVLVANENYWRAEGDPVWEGGPSGLPKIQRIVHRVVNEWGTRFAMMQAGDVAWGDVPQANRPQVDPWVGEICDAVTEECAPSSTPDAPLRMWINQASTSRTDIFMNQNIETDESGSNPYIGSGLLDGNGIPPDFFSDIHVRRAFAYCFDYDIYISDGQNGEGIRNSSMIITNMLGYNPDQEMFQFDLDKCAEELALAWDGQVAEVGFRVQATTNTGNLERQT